jgi:hypothetical protein
MPLTSLICINGKKHLTAATLINAWGARGLVACWQFLLQLRAGPTQGTGNLGAPELGTLGLGVEGQEHGRRPEGLQAQLVV